MTSLPRARAGAERGPDERTFRGFAGRVDATWIDPNRHMNVSWYDHVFDQAESALFAAFGIDDAYIRSYDLTTFRIEKLIRYERELMEGDAIEVRSRILHTNGRLVHHFHEIWNIGVPYRAAIADCLSIHVDLSIRKSAVITDPEIRQRLEALASAHAKIPVPAGAARRFETD